MALSKFTPAQSVANQIRTKSLGVKTGGTQGRMGAFHKGVGLNKNSGGRNARGSGVRVTGTFGTPVRAPGRPSTGTFTASRPAATPRPVAPATQAPATPVAAATPPVAARPTGPLDYRGLSSYMSGSADLQYQLAGDRSGLQRQLDDLKPQYERAQVEAKRGYERAIEDSEDDMNHGGLLRSGKREVVDADRYREFNDHLGQVEKNLGAGAAAQITQALARLDEYEAQQKLALEAQARQEYDQMYPAAPLDVSAPVAEVAAAGGAVPTSIQGMPVRDGAVVAPNRVAAGTPAPVASMTLAQAIAAFKGARTYKAPDGSMRRTAAWAKYLDDNGIKA